MKGCIIMNKEVDVMQRVLNNMENFKIPPHIEREIGLKKDWKKNISSEKTNAIITTANRFKKALRKLSKN